MGCTSSTTVQQLSIHEVYDFQGKLGQGAFGQVRACMHRNTERECAVKILDVNGSAKRKADAAKEGMLWKRVAGHRHIVGLLESYGDKEFNYFVMDRCERSLCDMLLKRPGVQECDLLLTFRQMLLGLEHCHSMKVVHRDVKPANFLVTSHGAVKLCDFGLAEMEKVSGITGLTGTAPFMSPEMVKGQSYDCNTDIWSLGATAYLMLYGRYLYKITKDKRYRACELMHQAIAKNSPAPRYEADQGLPEPSGTARGFVQALLQRDPKSRPSASECLELDVMMSANGAVQERVNVRASVAPTIKLAKQMTAELKVPVDPTVAKKRDDLLEQLQKQYRTSTPFVNSFSLPTSGEKSLGCTKNQFRPTMSYGGEMSINAMNSDNLSECSTACSSRSGSSLTS
jgi:serine/threonine protein kinase